jgi:hypothetical protein
MESGPARCKTKPSLPNPPTGARSHPVAKASSARFSSTEKEFTTSQNLAGVGVDGSQSPVKGLVKMWLALS